MPVNDSTRSSRRSASCCAPAVGVLFRSAPHNRDRGRVCEVRTEQTLCKPPQSAAPLCTLLTCSSTIHSHRSNRSLIALFTQRPIPVQRDIQCQTTLSAPEHTVCTHIYTNTARKRTQGILLSHYFNRTMRNVSVLTAEHEAHPSSGDPSILSSSRSHSFPRTPNGIKPLRWRSVVSDRPDSDWADGSCVPERWTLLQEMDSGLTEGSVTSSMPTR